MKPAHSVSFVCSLSDSQPKETMAPPATLKGFARADGPLRGADDYADLTPTEQQEVVKMIDEHLSEQMHEGTMQRMRRIQGKDIQGLELFVAGISGASEACTSGKPIKTVLQDLRKTLATEAETDDEVVFVDKPGWLTEPLVAVRCKQPRSTRVPMEERALRELPRPGR